MTKAKRLRYKRDLLTWLWGKRLNSDSDWLGFVAVDIFSTGVENVDRLSTSLVGNSLKLVVKNDISLSRRLASTFPTNSSFQPLEKLTIHFRLQWLMTNSQGWIHPKLMKLENGADMYQSHNKRMVIAMMSAMGKVRQVTAIWLAVDTGNNWQSLTMSPGQLRSNGKSSPSPLTQFTT